MPNFPFNDPVACLGRTELEELLRSFEDAWATSSGERLTSAAFYDSYRAGEIDSLFATSWASYYEHWRALGRRDAGETVSGLPEALIAPLAAC
jgi:hypothetical protein